MIVDIVVFAVLGAFTWTLLEYTIHRWLGHDRRFRPNPFAKEHVRHHVEGDYFAPTWKKALLSLFVGPVVAALASLGMGLVRGVAFAAGLMVFYGAYELLHRREHTHAGIGAYGRWARRHHFQHHFVDGRMNHGVTTPLWDLVFGTYQKPTHIVVPPKLCMTWLRDPATGGIREEHAAVFSLGKSPRDRRGDDGEAASAA